MKSQHISAIVVAVIAIVGWNVFLIQRDNKMFNEYDRKIERKEFCKNNSTFKWNSNCN